MVFQIGQFGRWFNSKGTVKAPSKWACGMGMQQWMNDSHYAQRARCFPVMRSSWLNLVPSNLWYKPYQILKLKCLLSRLAVVAFAQSIEAWTWFSIQMPSYQYRKSHCGDKTVVRSSYLDNRISYTGNMTSLYWIRAQVLSRERRYSWSSVDKRCSNYTWVINNFTTY